MATLREKKPGVWEVRVFTGMNARGRPTQLSRTVHGTKRDAQRLAADMEVGPGRASSGGRLVSDALDAWVEQSLGTWAPSSARDQQSRVKAIVKDQIVRVPLARLSVADVGAGTRGYATAARPTPPPRRPARRSGSGRALGMGRDERRVARSSQIR